MGCSQSQHLDTNTELLSASELRRLLNNLESPVKFYDKYEAYPFIKDLESCQTKQMSSIEFVLCNIEGYLSEMGEVMDKWTQKYKEFNHPNLLMIHYISVSEFQLMVVPQVNINMLIDFPVNSLFHHSDLLKQRSLQESEVWFMIDCVSAALSFMQEQKILCYNLNPKDIFMVRTPFNMQVYKISDRFWKPAYDCGGFNDFIINADNSKTIKELKRFAYMSPIQIQSLATKNKYPVQNLFKSQIFIFGLIILHCLDCKSHQDSYDWDNWRINVKSLEERLDNLNSQSLYSEELLTLVSNMLKIDEEDRYDCINLNDQISNIYNKVNKQRLLQVYSELEFTYDYKNNNLENYQEKVLQQIKKEDFSKSKVQTMFNLISSDPYKQKIQLTGRSAEGSSLNEFKLHKTPQAKKQIETNAIVETSPQAIRIVTDYNVQSEIPNYTQSKMSTIINAQNKLTYPNGYYYIGQHTDHKRNGKGACYDENNRKICEGNWVDDNPQGQFIFYNYPNENTEQEQYNHKKLNQTNWQKFDGQLNEGIKKGKGRLVFQNGDCFEGDFKDNKANGKGIYFYSNGKQMKGEWKDDIYKG